MAQQEAIDFIKEIVKNQEIRKSLYKYDTSSEIMGAIREMGYHFRFADFDESIHHLKTESPHESQADMLDELRMWWHMLMDDGNLEEEEEESSCSPAKCSSCSMCG